MAVVYDICTTFITCLTLVPAMTVSNCQNNDCPQPLCANPAIQPGECCPSCRESKCQFKGCVQFETNNKVRWWPEPCSVCSCYGGRDICMMYSCMNIENVYQECLVTTPPTKVGYRPYVCCPRCEYHIPENACELVPSEIKNFSTPDGNPECRGTYTDYKCDKVGFRKDRKKFRCTEERIDINITRKGCNSVYNTAVSCTVTEDPTLMYAEGCDLYIS